jgi:hypothetical protein
MVKLVVYVFRLWWMAWLSPWCMMVPNINIFMSEMLVYMSEMLV